ncbi:MAG TPA: hypothetical protein ENI79_02200 [Rhodospirillales bacterium]|nr:hypothetical protein [Rhodospirillales bacterium]
MDSLLNPAPSSPGDHCASGSVTYFTSGTLASPKRVTYTADDWRETVQHRAECLSALGIVTGERVAVLASFGPWFSGDNLVEALREIGANVLPAGVYAPHLPAVARLLDRLHIRTLVTTPSVALALSRHIDEPAFGRIVTIGERAPRAVRDLIESRLGARPRGLFAASEVIVGFEVAGKEDLYRWDPGRLHLEVLDGKGRVMPEGRGELLVTRRHGTATPLLRYRLGDLVDMVNPDGPEGPLLRHMGRISHGFTLASGVKVSRADLDRFLDDLSFHVYQAHFTVEHSEDGFDRLVLALGGDTAEINTRETRNKFIDLNFEIADVISCDLLDVEVRTFEQQVTGKRRIVIEETPWAL